MPETRAKGERAAVALDSPASVEALRPPRLPSDARVLLGDASPSEAPPEPDAQRPSPPAANPAVRGVLWVLGGVLAMWVLAMLVLAVLHYAR